jgi:predicted PurR-regulated permease PerM
MKNKKIIKNKGKIKNNLKRKMLIGKNGSATAETILIIAIFLVIIVTAFYPQINTIMSNTFTSINNWYLSALSNIGIY